MPIDSIGRNNVWSIETLGLSKSYGNFTSLSDCDLRVPRGTVFGLLGPNGAGKTTLIRLLLGFIRPTRGSAMVSGFDIAHQSIRVREQVSYLPADARLYRSMRGSSILELFAGLHRYGDLQRSRETAERLELDISRRVMFMSTGMRQKLAIAVVLGCNAPLVVLDEPTANLDPNVRGEVLKLVSEIRDRGNTVVLSSHIFSDIDEACDHVAILRNGRLVAQQELQRIQETHIAVVDLPSSGTGIPKAGIPKAGVPKAGVPEFVQYVDVSTTQLAIHLSGSPNAWMRWLIDQPLAVKSIQKAGVQALYDRYSSGDSSTENGEKENQRNASQAEGSGV